MDELLIELRRRVKQLLAASLFLILLLGGSAAALALLAAGISALSSPTTLAIASPSSYQQYVSAVDSKQPNPNQSNVPTVNQQTAEQADQTGTNPLQTSQSTSPVSTSSNTSAQNSPHYTDFSEALNEKVDHMQSPIGEAINNGGVVVGNQIQHSFGDFLAGVLQTLFLERSDRPTRFDSVKGGGNG